LFNRNEEALIKRLEEQEAKQKGGAAKNDE
jgi:hypothetical protein